MYEFCQTCQGYEGSEQQKPVMVAQKSIMDGTFTAIKNKDVVGTNAKVNRDYILQRPIYSTNALRRTAPPQKRPE